MHQAVYTDLLDRHKLWIFLVQIKSNLNARSMITLFKTYLSSQKQWPLL